jgi:hypothetical protein
VAKDKVGSFNFGANVKPKKAAKGKARGGKGKKGGNAWQNYTGGK